jgi:hypothetical protein
MTFAYRYRNSVLGSVRIETVHMGISLSSFMTFLSPSTDAAFAEGMMVLPFFGLHYLAIDQTVPQLKSLVFHHSGNICREY